MALRVRLTQADLDNVRFAAGPAPILEAILAFASFERRTPTRTTLPPTIRPLFSLVRDARGPVFLDPFVADPQWGLELVRSAPKALIREDMERMWCVKPPLWLRNLADGDSEQRQVVGTAVRYWYQRVIEPQRHRIEQVFQHDIAMRTPTMRDVGVVGLLNSIHPNLTYHDGVLTMPHPLDITCDLEGQGFELRPTTQWAGRPLWSWSSDDPSRFALHYPALSERTRTVQQPTEQALAKLVGETRAAVMHALKSPLSTGELAERVGVSISSASQHACVLRDVGLVRSVRDGQKVTHSLTMRGMTLLGFGQV
ncbi:ArsR/SmtB family transcription factor [Actinocrispum wychmicini]|uniref:DNA-binding transcriptional ArsR family regulator n=1 Tax=Actinocrispum wychmicini TaxID=1213861 RepID=A0A4R2IZ20_9PSEU|nr:helix-turn-helix domain-containing protein [Actinocrispum wychmicini]TCO49726.1 DNA-binding transcriptional ArsR family regulator [Actinocrispum wychmicini]